MASVNCPVCGAKIRLMESPQNYHCDFCHFTRRPALEIYHPQYTLLQQSFKDLPQLLKLKPLTLLHLDDTYGNDISCEIENFSYPVKIVPLKDCSRNIDAIWSDMTLPFIEDLSGFLSQKFKQLNSGGLLYLSLPVKRPFRSVPPLPGQINYFMPKNIMFLLEQRGFKMIWRKNRFSPTLRIIARKD